MWISGPTYEMCSHINNTFHTNYTTDTNKKKESKKIAKLSNIDTLDSSVFPSSVNVEALSLVWFRRPTNHQHESGSPVSS